jgi:hypothetical protein
MAYRGEQQLLQLRCLTRLVATAPAIATVGGDHKVHA